MHSAAQSPISSVLAPIGRGGIVSHKRGSTKKSKPTPQPPRYPSIQKNVGPRYRDDAGAGGNLFTQKPKRMSKSPDVPQTAFTTAFNNLPSFGNKLGFPEGEEDTRASPTIEEVGAAAASAAAELALAAAFSLKDSKRSPENLALPVVVLGEDLVGEVDAISSVASTEGGRRESVQLQSGNDALARTLVGFRGLAAFVDAVP